MKIQFDANPSRTGGQYGGDHGRNDNDGINSSTMSMLASYWSAPMEEDNEAIHDNHKKFVRIQQTNSKVASPMTATTTTKTSRPLINETNVAASQTPTANMQQQLQQQQLWTESSKRCPKMTKIGHTVASNDNDPTRVKNA